MRSSLILILLLGFPALVVGQPHSKLWGESGELWSEDSRLPDFSHAGYHRGEQPLPEREATHNLQDFGAVPDDGEDDSAAFLKAIEEVEDGVILIPEGRYIVTEILEIRKPNIVLRGESRDGTVLYFPKTLTDIKPNWGATTGGRRTSNYSWSGGFINAHGSFQSETLARIVAKAKRGERSITVGDAEALEVGQEVEVYQQDDADDSLAHHLYSEEAGDTEKLRGRTRARLIARITAIEGDRVRLDRPLRFDISSEWQPVLRRFDPTVEEVGVENLTFEFPVKPYEGHFTELGHNAIQYGNVANSWIRNIRVLHADSGVYMRGRFCTLDGIVFESDRERDSGRNATGHHGVTVSGDDNLVTNFDFRTRFVHDLTVTHCAGNVFSKGKAEDLCLDHHKRAPYENLFTDIDAGTGTQLWRCGGGAALGKHCAARGTFWNITADRPLKYPPERFGPWSMNLVGVKTDGNGVTDRDGKWFEVINPAALEPQNLHEAQRERRLAEAPAAN